MIAKRPVISARLPICRPGWMPSRRLPIRSLGDFVSRFKCKRDGAHPTTLRLLSDPIGPNCHGMAPDPSVQVIELEIPRSRR